MSLACSRPPQVAASCQSFEGRVRVFIARERQRDLLKEMQDAAVAAAQVRHDMM